MFVVLMLLLACLTLASTTNALDELACESSPISWQADAELTDVFFLNANCGWAVGAQGVILRTINGGREWKEIGQVNSNPIVAELSFQEKINAMQSGQRTAVTGVADGRSDQPQKFRCRFESVFFIDEQNGWVAGGYDVPYLAHSRGILLRTSDGGASWRRVKGALLPRIKRIHFANRSQGWAVGEHGNLFGTSLFSTSDGGESWSSQTQMARTAETLGYLDGDITDQGYVAIDSQGQPVTLRNGRQEEAAVQGQGREYLRKIRMLGRDQGWCVGDEGAVWRTTNGGLSWSSLASDPSSEIHTLLREFDFHALAVAPSKIWFAGNPGTLIFSIDRNQGEILSYSTGIATPIRAIHFIDDRQGWLVGTFGTIMSTSDGGKSWQRLNGRQRSVAILGLAYDQPELPLEVLGRYSCEEDFLVAIGMFDPLRNRGAEQSVDRLGGVGLFSLAPGRQSTNVAAEDSQLERLVRLIRTLKPNVLLCNSEYRKLAQTTGKPQSAFDPHSMLAAAAAAAADREQFSRQIELARLEPWTVDRIAYRVPAGALELDPRRMLLRLGHLLEDQIAISRGLNGLSLATPEKKFYRIQFLSPFRTPNDSDLMGGLSAAGRAIAKRPADGRMRTNRAALELANRKQQKLFDLAQFTATTEQDFIVWNQKVLEWLASADDTLAGVWLAQLAERYLEYGKPMLAAKSLELLTNRYDGHSLHTASLTWLARYYASDEFARLEVESLLQMQRSPVANRENDSNQPPQAGQPSSKAYSSYQDGETITVWAPLAETIQLPKRAAVGRAENQTSGQVTNENSLNVDAEVKQASFIESESANESTPSAGGLTAVQIQAFLQYRQRRASHYLTQLSQGDPDLINQLQFRFLEANLKRRLGGNLMAEGTLKVLASARELHHGISAAATTELKLIEQNGRFFSEDILHSVAAKERPFLDGNLSDPLWQSVQRDRQFVRAAVRQIAEKSATTTHANGKSGPLEGEDEDRIYFAHDQEFMFVAVQCRKLPGQFYQMTNEARPRDPDLSRRDRIEIGLDLDRDYQSYYRFEIDYRGWASEEINGTTGWNPQWFIARAEDSETWTLEMAIPWQALVSIPRTGDEIWAIRLARRAADGNNLWISSFDDAGKRSSTDPSKGLYQKILAEPRDFRLFTFGD
jgi:photosystem II stability/assembly factor-like uncharacterized protein